MNDFTQPFRKGLGVLSENTNKRNQAKRIILISAAGIVLIITIVCLVLNRKSEFDESVIRDVKAAPDYPPISSDVSEEETDIEPPAPNIPPLADDFLLTNELGYLYEIAATDNYKVLILTDSNFFAVEIEQLLSFIPSQKTLTYIMPISADKKLPTGENTYSYPDNDNSILEKNMIIPENILSHALVRIYDGSNNCVADFTTDTSSDAILKISHYVPGVTINQ